VSSNEVKNPPKNWVESTPKHNVQHNNAQHNNAQQNNAQRNNVQHNNVQQNNVQSNNAQRNNVQSNNAQHNNAQRNNVQHNNAQHNNAQRNNVQQNNSNIAPRANNIAPKSTTNNAPRTSNFIKKPTNNLQRKNNPISKVKPLNTSVKSPEAQDVKTKKEVKKTPLRIIPLGGLNEIGKNLTVFECVNDAFLVDCGLAFPDSEMLGVDIVIPDFTYLEKIKPRLRGIVLTHGHEDHIGGIAYLLKKINLPIYGTALTLAEGVMDSVDRKKQWRLDEQTTEEDLRINSYRKDEVPGIHTVKYESEVDSIQITHDAKSRKGFALGAVVAAEFTANKKGFLGMKDLLPF